MTKAENIEMQIQLAIEDFNAILNQVKKEDAVTCVTDTCTHRIEQLRRIVK